MSALHVAVLNRHHDLTEWLIERGASLVSTTDNGATPLFLAAGQVGRMGCLAGCACVDCTEDARRRMFSRIQVVCERERES
jgi:hypothetical protein